MAEEEQLEKYDLSELLKMAAKESASPAVLFKAGLGMLFDSGKLFTESNTEFEIFLDAAIDYITRSLKQNYSVAAYTLAACYEKGSGKFFQKDLNKALLWIERAALINPEFTKKYSDIYTLAHPLDITVIKGHHCELFFSVAKHELFLSKIIKTNYLWENNEGVQRDYLLSLYIYRSYFQEQYNMNDIDGLAIEALQSGLNPNIPISVKGGKMSHLTIPQHYDRPQIVKALLQAGADILLTYDIPFQVMFVLAYKDSSIQAQLNHIYEQRYHKNAQKINSAITTLATDLKAYARKQRQLWLEELREQELRRIKAEKQAELDKMGQEFEKIITNTIKDNASTTNTNSNSPDEDNLETFIQTNPYDLNNFVKLDNELDLADEQVRKIEYNNSFTNYQNTVESNTSLSTAHYYLGWAYHKGRGRNEDAKKAYYHYQKSAEAGFTPAKVKLARLGYEKGKFNTERNRLAAIETYTEGLQENDTHAQYYLGLNLLEGVKDKDSGLEVIRANKNRGLELIKMAADKHDKSAAKWLGMYYDPSITTNSGNHKSYAEAKKWYEVAGNKNDVASLCNLALNYLLVPKVEFNPSEAFRLLFEAVIQKVHGKYSLNRLATAQFYFGWLHASDGPIFNKSTALFWLEKAHENGFDNQKYLALKESLNHPDLQKIVYNYKLRLSKLSPDNWQAYIEFARFLRVYKDIFINAEVRSKDYLLKAYRMAENANQLDKLSRDDHIDLYNYYMDNNPSQSIQIFNRAMSHYELGFTKDEAAEQYFNLSLKFAYGENVKQDSMLFIKYATKAAELGYAKAYYWLGEAYRNNIRGVYGKEITSYYTKAKECYKKAIENGFTPAYLGLGDMYRDGKGCSQSINSAIKLYKKALEDSTDNYDTFFVNAKFSAIVYNHIAVAYHEKGKLNTAIKYYVLAANQGHAQSMYRLGIIYRENKYNNKKAIYWLEKAVEKGHQDAKDTLAAVRREVNQHSPSCNIM